MKLELEPADLQTLAQDVADLITPLLRKEKDRDEIFDVSGLAAYLKTSTKWIYERTHLKEIPHYKTGGLLRFRKKEIDAWLAGFTVPAVSRPARLGALKESA